MFDLGVVGRAVIGGALQDVAIAVQNGRIVAIADPDADLPAREVVRRPDALILPGIVDVHVHTKSALEEGIAACTRAAAAGGVTTIVDMPYDADRRVLTLADFDQKVADVEREAHVDVALWATVPPVGSLEPVAQLVGAGAAAFKLSTFNTHSERFPQIPDGQLLAAFREIARAGGLAGVHSENDDVIRQRTAALVAAGRTDALAHAEARPPVAELEAISRCLRFANETGVRLHLCHVTLADGIDQAMEMRRRGLDVTTETCPQYLLLTERDLAQRGGEVKCNPPVRSPAEVEHLWQRLERGDIDLVSSDHVGWPAESKFGEDIFSLASGGPGVELLLPLMYDAFVSRGLDPTRLVALLCEAPARRFGLWPAKGALLPGADADLVLFDPGARWTVDPAALTCVAGWSPFRGRTLAGRVETVFLRGEPVVANGRVLDAPNRGRFVATGGRPPARPAPPMTMETTT
jgi:allantoinase